MVRAWQNLSAIQAELVTEEGEPVSVVYPGRINEDEGPDLLDAVIATRRGLLIGAVEVHVRSSGWWTHHHQHDPRYNQVILHAVFWHDSGMTACLANGNHVPTLALHKYTLENVPLVGDNKERASACRITGASRETMTASLDAAGDERFINKARGFSEELARYDASQVLYTGIMGALGYSRNKIPFQELSRRLPLQTLEAAGGVDSPDSDYLLRVQALLLGTAGLLPSQRGAISRAGEDLWIDDLERAWAAFPPVETMSANDWHMFKVRPDNFPTRRIAAVSRLLRQYRKQGILAAGVNYVGETAPENPSRLERMFTVVADGYWADHYDFAWDSSCAGAMLIGRGRAADIVVNILLPFVYAWGNHVSQKGLAVKALELYRGYPRLESNTVEKHMSQKLGLSKPVNTARRQQGLLHIYQTGCLAGKCDECLLY